MTKLNIPQAALEQHIAVLGKTGSGKTSTAKLLVEQVVRDDARVCILDTVKSDWWGLTSSADGKKPGLPFHILGGPHGHVPIHASAGRAIAEIAASGALRHSIIDMADFEAGGAQRFFVDFAPALLRNMRGVLYLVIEEAHELAPKERAGFGAENMSIHWAKKLATAGRSKGVRLVVLTQRTQSLHNALLGSCDTLIAHRFTAPADQEPVVKWLKSNLEPDLARTVAASLSSLKTGEGWLCAGEARIFERMQFPRIRTYDNSATPTDDDHQHDVKTAPVDQDKLRTIIGTAVKEAEANDPKLLRAEITKLKREAEFFASQAITGGKTSLDDAEKRGYARGIAAATRALKTAADAVSDHNATIAKGTAEIQRGTTGLATVQLRLINSIEPTAVFTTPRAAAEKSSMAHVARSAGPGSSELGNTGLRRMLIALAQRPRGLNRRQLGVRAGLSSQSGTFSTYLGKGRSERWINGGDVITITEEGVAALGAYDPLPEGRALLDYWVSELGDSGASRLLKAVADAYPKAISRNEAASLAGLSAQSGTFSTYLGRLRSLELVSGSGGDLQASEELFD